MILVLMMMMILVCANRGRNVLVKGGDLPDSSDAAIDIFFDGKEMHELHSPRLSTGNSHGTGCALASCIAAEVAKGSSMLEAVKAAKRYIESVLDYSRDIVIGNGGHGPMDHFLSLKNDRGFNPNSLLLYAVTDSATNRKWGRSIADAVRAAVEGGVTMVQLREKETEAAEFLEIARTCVEICRSHGVPLIINDRADIALACDADGVHVGRLDMPAAFVRKLLGPRRIIGVTCRTAEEARQASIHGDADYIGCGAVFLTNTKGNSRTIGLHGLKQVCLAASPLPVVAIGGISTSNAPSIIQIAPPNLKGVALVSALFDAPCVFTQARILHHALTLNK